MAAKNKTAQPRLFKDGDPSGKLVVKIDEVCRLTKVSPEALEAWEKEFPFLRAGRTGTGQRYYRPKDVEIVQRIRDLVAAKSLTMAGIKRRVEEEFGLKPSGTVHPETLKKALCDVRDELQDIVGVLGRRAGKGTG